MSKSKSRLTNFKALICLSFSFGLALLFPGIMLRLKVPLPSIYFSVNLCPTLPPPDSTPLSENLMQFHNSFFCKNKGGNLISLPTANITDKHISRNKIEKKSEIEARALQQNKGDAKLTQVVKKQRRTLQKFPLHNRMLISDLEYVPAVTIPHPLHVSGNIIMSLENEKGEILFEVNQKLDHGSLGRSIIRNEHHNLKSDVHIYDPKNNPSWSQSSVHALHPDNNTKIPMAELLLMESRFLLDSNGGKKEQFVENLTLRIHEASVLIPNTKMQNSRFSLHQKNPVILLGFHPISLSTVQRSGVTYIIQGLVIILITLAMVSTRAYVFPKDRKKIKEEIRLKEKSEKGTDKIKKKDVPKVKCFSLFPNFSQHWIGGADEVLLEENHEEENICHMFDEVDTDSGEEEWILEQQLENALREERTNYLMSFAHEH